MSDAKAAGSDALYLQLSPNWLLQLPGPALDLALQKLDVCSLISIAASCSQLYHSLPWQASLSRVQITCSQESLGSFKLLHERHRACLANLRHCSIGAEQNSNEWRDIKRHPWAGLRDLPLPHLCELHLEGLELQLESADGFSGVLHDCTDLISLQIEQCQVVATPAASAAIAALPKLRHLWLLDNYEGQESTGSLFGQIRLTRPVFPELQHPLQITNLSLDLDNQPVEHLTQLEQLSALVNLEELTLHGLPDGGVPGGLPSQLVKLKSLYIQADEWCAAEHFQHLGRYTALQDFGVDFGYFRADYLAGIGQLSQLTCLALRYDDLTSSMDFSTASTSTWAQLSALQKLSLSNCAVQPEALAAFSQLRDLELDFRRPLGDTALKGVLSAMSKLAQLTKLSVSLDGVLDTAPAVSGEVFTSLTASTNLCSPAVLAQQAVLAWVGTVQPLQRVPQPAHNRLPVQQSHAHGRAAHPAVVQLLPSCGEPSIRPVRRHITHSLPTSAGADTADSFEAARDVGIGSRHSCHCGTAYWAQAAVLDGPCCSEGPLTAAVDHLDSFAGTYTAHWAGRSGFYPTPRLLLFQVKGMS
jgi:hypothetical protein